jgi:predicted N-formylglutamate amidohydrolase
MPSPLLAADEPPPFELLNPAGRGRALLFCDHANRIIPRGLNQLGLQGDDLTRHIAWDIGAADATRHMSAVLDAPAVLCNYSRLVVDCNRMLQDATLIPRVSDGTAIPGNAAISEADRQRRLTEIYAPYHRAIEDLAEELRRRHGVAAMLSIHSCTERMNGQFRPWEIGVCWEKDDRMAKPVMEALRRKGTINVGDNQPYGLVAGEDASVPLHAVRRGWPHFQVELRQDLIATSATARQWADILIDALRPVLAESDLYRPQFFD